VIELDELDQLTYTEVLEKRVEELSLRRLTCDVHSRVDQIGAARERGGVAAGTLCTLDDEDVQTVAREEGAGVDTAESAADDDDVIRVVPRLSAASLRYHCQRVACRR
jgi:hypothetical protein